MLSHWGIFSSYSIVILGEHKLLINKLTEKFKIVIYLTNNLLYIHKNTNDKKCGII